MRFLNNKNRYGGGLSHSKRILLTIFLLLQLFIDETKVEGSVLIPPSKNLALGRRIKASHTCGELKGRPYKDMYCNLAGATQYTPHNQYSYRHTDGEGKFKEFYSKEYFVQGGQICDHCLANSSLAHPAENMVDGSPSWWQSPPLSRGMQYKEINITIDLEQEFFVAYIWIQMANSPRPGIWILEHSKDFGQTYEPWQYFASSYAECSRVFGVASLSPIVDDDSVICTTEYSKLDKMENGEIILNLLENRPGAHRFMSSEKLQNFTRATNVRLRLLRPKTLQGHLMDLHGKEKNFDKNDATVTRRYFYGIKEILMGGRCICNGHADSCDILDARRSRTWLCRCEHNTCGDNCERCCDGFVQKKWKQNNELREFKCEPCNCHGHSDECVFSEEIAANNQSLDIHGIYEGGGRCLQCKDNTEGINCNKCKHGYYRPIGKLWTDVDVCQACVCDPEKHSGNCAEETGKCECLAKFTGPNCDQCAEGYYHAPECRPCECNVNGTMDNICLPTDGKCPCKEGFGGAFCDICLSGYTNVTAGCIDCECNLIGSINNECDKNTEQCSCKSNYAGKKCEKCSNGYFNHPACDYCDCDPTGTEEDICDQKSGQCLCKLSFAGRRCEKCDENYYGYPNCKECACNDFGSQTANCSPITGECPCYHNFTSRTCDKCAASYYRYPECLECGCSTVGAKGVTCDNDGQCYCKPNFEGARCDRCMEKRYNFPICEECNCHPSGVIPEFAGCDKVGPGELCTCRENVMGRTCSQCKPTFWDLQPYHNGGCVDCNCNKTGTVSLLNDCDKISGQCTCKRYVTGIKCDMCADGFYNMQSNSHVGCQACNCDIGGSYGTNCNQNTGQCNCRPRIRGLKCDQPAEDHYYPTPWQFQYEAEDGRLPDGKNVRFAIDTSEFPNFSWRGFVVFSPIQDEIILDINIRKAAVYKLLLHYKNPTKVSVDVEIKFIPINTQTQDSEQKAKIVLEPTVEPVDRFINTDEKPFVLNPGKWNLKINSIKRLFLDYIVLIPSEYYQGSLLNEVINEPCKANETDKTTCVELLYPPLPITNRVDSTNLNQFKVIDSKSGHESLLETMPDSILPKIVGEGVLIKTDSDHSKEFRVDLEVPESNTYYMLLEYFNVEENSLPIKVHVEQNDKLISDGVFIINYCPYATFCRELFSLNGLPAKLELANSPPIAQAIFFVQPSREFAIASVNLIKKTDWNNDFLKQIAVCIKKDSVCIGQQYPQPPNSIITEAEAGANQNNSISGDKLPFSIANPDYVHVMSIDNVQSTLDVEGVVASPGDYVFVVHFFNPDNLPITNDVLIQSERFADVHFFYCPSTTGCRTIVMDKQNTGQKFFHIDDKYLLTFYHNNTQKGPIYIDYVIAVPYESFTEAALRPLPIDISTEFSKACSAANYHNAPEEVKKYCRDKIFSLTSDFNSAALSCDCNAKGSLDFTCSEYGGQCRCKPNVIGRTCDRCAPGFYNYPECIKCKCGENQQCDERNGQCLCPPLVVGQLCDKCVPYAYGYDRLIGCQLCGCHKDGSHNGELECDALNGQCLCKANVGGRRCEKCLPGFYGFPHCYECACEDSGTTDAICDVNSAKCLCKKNVIGDACDSCRPGTFDLRKSDVDGCSECFCFGATDRCRSSEFPVQTISFDDQSWQSDDPNGLVEGYEGQIIYTASSDDSLTAKSVYLVAPIVKGKDYTKAYGLHLSFIISSLPSNSKPRSNSASDVRIVSGNTVLEYWAPEQPSNLSRPFKVVVSLFPEYWLLNSGEPSSRQQLMMVLLKLEKILIKASYYENPKKAILQQFELEVGENNSIERGFITASSVEVCECPPPYIGSSCQLCAQGYYRVISSGSLLGSCVPCNCYGHSGTCDPDTGRCANCQHNTKGDHCELCVEGFYGNATTGSPSSCLACACPYPSPTNNFATSCFVSDRGDLERCVCQNGYSGMKCESCATGFFGQPTMPGGYCEKCFCNNNNNLMDEESCHPITGDCALCEANTDGRKCEECKEWFYGDAIQTKNCTECKCDQCGSQFCDNKNGNCECHPLVVGKNCDRCQDNAWNFQSCHGCQECNCGIAAANSQCDLKTGQCACMPGAMGMHCEQCQHGYWNYGPQGCKECDCVSDLALGTVCDVNTGQCHCQEGASGPRCDSCIDTYLKIPQFGCRFCDECVFALNSELDIYDVKVVQLNNTLGNVSSVALTGARLKRIHKNINDIDPILDSVISADSEADQLNLLAPNIANVKDSASSIVIRANRTMDQLNSQIDQLNKLFDQLIQLRDDANDLIDVSKWVIKRVEMLKDSFTNTVPVENREQIIVDSERLLTQIKENEKVSEMENLKQKLENVTETLDRINTLKNKSQIIFDKIKTERQRLNSLKNSSIDIENQLQTTKNTIQDVKNILNSLSLFSLKASINGIEKDSQEIEKFIQIQQEQMKNVTKLLNTFRDINDSINSQLIEISELKNAISMRSDSGRRIRRDLDQTKVEQKVKELEHNAQRINGIYDEARLEASSTVKAATIYKDVISILNQAKNLTQNAQIKSALARKVGRGKKEQSKQSKLKSEGWLKQAEELDQKTMKELQHQRQRLQERVDELLPKLEDISNEFKQLNLSITDNLSELDQILDKSDKAYTDLSPINESLDQMKPSIDSTDSRVKQLIESNVGLTQSTDTAKDQIQQVLKAIPESKQAWEEAKLRLANTTSLVEECKTRLAYLKEKIAVARDKANRIKLGAHFEKGSVLELPVPQLSDDFGTYTQIRIFFRTRDENGLLLYFGNDNARIGGEFISMEIERGKPKVILNFGRDPVIVALEAKVDDYHWREFIVERVGKWATIKVTKPRSDSQYEDEKKVITPGQKFVLNLFDDSRRLFVGGVPFGFRIPSIVRQNAFIGDLDKLRLNGELIGFWNSEKAVQISGADMRTPLDAEQNAESGVSFNGKGYMQIGVGAWNPRKRTAILLSFMTFSPDGLLFFVGKDRDQLVIELIDGRISLSFDLGSGLGRLTSNGEHYNDGKWHMLQINRVERQAKLTIDGSDVSEGESPGSLFEMSVSDSFYVGGLPRNIETRFTVQPFRGCIKNLKLDSEYVSLNRAKATKGVQTSCLNKEVRVVSLVSERSYAHFQNLTIENQIELSFRMRTVKSDAHVATVIVSDEEIFRINLESGLLVIRPNGDENELIKVELSTRLSGHWHYLTIQRTKDSLKAYVDDVFSEEINTNDISDLLMTDEALLVFGRSTHNEQTSSFVGCIGDVIWNGKLLSFAQSIINEVKLTGCTIGGAISSPSTNSNNNNEKITIENGSDDNEAKDVKLPSDSSDNIPATKSPSSGGDGAIQPPSSNVRPDGSCALPHVPHGEREDSNGIRFGLQSGSRLEFDRVPYSFDSNIIFSIQMRATAANGILMFVTNEKHSDFITLYMQEGRILFTFGSGNARLTIQGKQSILDDEWHSVRAEREGTGAALFIDERSEAENRTEGTEIIDAQPPLYIGGLPSDLVPFAARILPGVKSEFGGCLREFKLNDKKLENNDGREIGTVPCSQLTEQGIFFGKDGGYAIISPQFVVGQSFSFELEVKPRTKNAVLLSVGVLEFLTLQILNGTVKFSVDNGAGVESVIYEPTSNNLICDGHWHHIKIYKKKNLITLNVDGKSNLRIMKKKAVAETSTKDPLYLGGVPKDVKLRGLNTVDPYIGCVRVLNKKSKRKRDTQISLDLDEKMNLFGNVERSSCPLN